MAVLTAFSFLESLVKKLNKDDFKYLSQEFDKNKLDLVKDFILMNIWLILKSLKKNYQAKKSSIVRSQVKKIRDKEYHHVINVWNKFEMKTLKEYHDLYL